MIHVMYIGRTTFPPSLLLPSGIWHDFILQDDRLITPPCSDGALDGIIRQVLLERGTIKGLACQEATISRSQLRSCDALFVTNSLIGAQAAQSLSLKNEPPIKKGSPRYAEILLEIRSFAF